MACSRRCRPTRFARQPSARRGIRPSRRQAIAPFAIRQHQVLGRDAHAVGAIRSASAASRARAIRSRPRLTPPRAGAVQRNASSWPSASRCAIGPQSVSSTSKSTVAAGDRRCVHGALATRAQPGVGGRSARHFALPVEVVAVAVGEEGPGDMPVAADDHPGRPGRVTPRDVAAGHGGIRSAGGRGTTGWVHAGRGACRWRRSRGRRRSARRRRRNCCLACPGRCGPGAGPVGAGSRAMGRAGSQAEGNIAARAPNGGASQRRCRRGASGPRRVGQVRADPPQREFARVVGILQVEVHRHADQRGCPRAPGRRRLPQQVGPRPHAQAPRSRRSRRPRTHRGPRALVAGDAGHLAATRARMRCRRCRLSVSTAIGPNSAASSPGGATQQVHLEVAFLVCIVAERAHRVGFAGGIDGHRAVGVARSRLAAARAATAPSSVRRTAAAQQPPGQQQERHHARQQRQRAALWFHRLIGIPQGRDGQAADGCIRKGRLPDGKRCGRIAAMTAACAALNNRNNASPRGSAIRARITR